MGVDPKVKETRDPAYLDAELRNRWELAYNEFCYTYPDEPEPFLVQTYRSPERQNELYAQGRTTPGSIVTHVKGGGSFHNVFPALAFDVAFRIPNDQGGPWAREDLFRKFGEIGMRLGLEWGGSWTDFVDMPHFQVPELSLRQIAAGTPIPWKPLKPAGPVITGDIKFNRVFIVEEDAIVELKPKKLTLVGDKLYVGV